MAKDYFTLILIPHSSEKATYCIKVPRWLVHAALFVFVSSAIIFSASFLYSTRVTRKLVSYEVLKEEAKGQDKQIQKFSKQTDFLRSKLDELVKKEEQIRKMLGLGIRSTRTVRPKVDPNNKETVNDRIKDLNKKISDRKKSLEELSASVKQLRERFANTPSIWPSWGRIMSTFGYRSFPWRGMHTGIDINASYGSPIRAAADGVIVHSSWKTGYGNTVIIDHGFGVKTLYGHISSFVVKAGQKVKKGQMIARIGTTGYATGPHVHYEVIKNGTAVDPYPYLNLNVFSAGK